MVANAAGSSASTPTSKALPERSSRVCEISQLHRPSISEPDVRRPVPGLLKIFQDSVKSNLCPYESGPKINRGGAKTQPKNFKFSRAPIEPLAVRP
jgi:hypothetical protein